jgi:hypothetical protein
MSAAGELAPQLWDDTLTYRNPEEKDFDWYTDAQTSQTPTLNGAYGQPSRMDSGYHDNDELERICQNMGFNGSQPTQWALTGEEVPSNML